MLGTVDLSNETEACDRLPKQEGGETGSDVVFPTLDFEPNKSAITCQEVVPKDTMSNLYMLKQEGRSSSLEARNVPYALVQGEDTCPRSADFKLPEGYEAVRTRPIHGQNQKQETSLMAYNAGENEVIAPISSNGRLAAAVQPSQLYYSPSQRSGTLENSSFVTSKGRPLDATPAYPTEIDVIFGRGEPTRKHPGNVIFREHVNKWLEEYMKGSKTTKSSIIRRVIDDVASSGARYLVPLNATCRLTIFTAGCREARKAEIRSKVSHAFRDGERRILLLQRVKDGNLEDVSNGKQQPEQSTNAKCGDLEQRSYHFTSVVGNKPLAAMSFSSNDDSQHDFRGPELLHSPKRKGLMQKNRMRSENDIPNKETNSISPSQSTSPQDFDVGGERTSDPVSTSTDLLSFANILTSLRRNAPPQSPGEDRLDQPHPSTTGTPGELATAPEKEKKQQRESQSKKDTSKNSSRIVQSLEKFCRDCDIVFGRGAPLRQHPGNIRFRRIVSKYNKKYGDASKHEKTAIIQNVIRELQSEGAKFLMMDDSSGVTEASPDEIRMKVSHRFRDFTKGKSNNCLKSKTKENSKKSASAPVVAPPPLSNGGEFLIEV